MALELPVNLQHIQNRLFSELSFSLKDWDPRTARRMVEKRIRETEKQFYVNLALQSYLSHAPNRLQIVRGIQALGKKEAAEGPAITLKEAIEGAGLAAGATHMAGLHELVPYATWAGAVLLPARSAILRIRRTQAKRQQQPLSFAAQELVRHPKPEAGELSRQKRGENARHLENKTARLRQEYEEMHFTLKWLDALHELLKQPRSSTEYALQEWRRRGALKVFGNRIGWWLRRDAPPTPNFELPHPPAPTQSAWPQAIRMDYDNLRMHTVPLRTLTPAEVGSEQAWLELQQRLDEDEKAHVKAMEVQFDLAERERAIRQLDQMLGLKKRLEKRERQLANPNLSESERRKLEDARAQLQSQVGPVSLSLAIEALKQRNKELKKKYPQPTKAAEQLHRLLDGDETVDVFRIARF